HTTVAATHDVPLWQLFPPGADAVFLIVCGALAFTYPLRDHRARGAFTTRARIAHLAAMIAAFVIIPTFASIILRETGKPYTYIHDGALMIEEASRKLLAGMNPYVADYLDTPMFFWPMINNPALYHLTYFPFMFLVSTPFVWFFDHFGFIWDQRYLYLPAYIGTLALVPYLVRGAAPRLAMTAAIALNPQLFPFVVNNLGAFWDDVVSYNAGGAAWTYPISGMGFSAILLGLGLIPYRQADFPFAAIEIAIATPIAAWWLIRLWQRPTIARLLA